MDSSFTAAGAGKKRSASENLSPRPRKLPYRPDTNSPSSNTHKSSRHNSILVQHTTHDSEHFYLADFRKLLTRVEIFHLQAAAEDYQCCACVSHVHRNSVLPNDYDEGWWSAKAHHRVYSASPRYSNCRRVYKLHKVEGDVVPKYLAAAREGVNVAWGSNIQIVIKELMEELRELYFTVTKPANYTGNELWTPTPFRFQYFPHLSFHQWFTEIIWGHLEHAAAEERKKHPRQSRS